MGGKFLLRLNISERPIANKYREGKVKRTLKRKLKVREIVKRETFPGIIALLEISPKYLVFQVHFVASVSTSVFGVGYGLRGT